MDAGRHVSNHFVTESGKQNDKKKKKKKKKSQLKCGMCRFIMRRLLSLFAGS